MRYLVNIEYALLIKWATLTIFAEYSGRMQRLCADNWQAVIYPFHCSENDED
jgi:hypothetical protein